jgi:hypothetical protein
MEYNKFIYKINKYKSYLRDSEKKRKDHYQKKIDFYYNKIDEIVTNIKNHKGGAFTNADLMNFIEPTTNELEQKLNKTANINVFQDEQKKYEENHIKIIRFLDELLKQNTQLDILNKDAENQLNTIREQMKQMDEKHRQEIQEKLEQIKLKIDQQKKLSLKDIESKYKIKL